MNDITPLGIGQWPSIIKQNSGEVGGDKKHLTVSYEEPYIYITGIYAYFDYPGVKGTIDVYVGNKDLDEANIDVNDIVFTHTFYGQSAQSEKDIEKTICSALDKAVVVHCSKKPGKDKQKGAGGSFSSSFPNMFIANNYGADKAIKVRLTVDNDRSDSNKKTKANLTVLNLDIPMDYYVE